MSNEAFSMSGMNATAPQPRVETIINYETSFPYQKFFKGNEQKKLWI